jgi:hypothetical protein
MKTACGADFDNRAFTSISQSLACNLAPNSMLISMSDSTVYPVPSLANHLTDVNRWSSLARLLICASSFFFELSSAASFFGGMVADRRVALPYPKVWLITLTQESKNWCWCCRIKRRPNREEADVFLYQLGPSSITCRIRCLSHHRPGHSARAICRPRR